MKAHKTELKAYNNFPKSFVGDDGITYPRKWLEDLDTAGREALGWYEVVDNTITLGANERAVKSPLVFTGTSIEQNYTTEAFSAEEIAYNAKLLKDETRAAGMNALTVTTASGKEFDGDEISQSRMARAVVSIDPLETTHWVLADNSVALVTREELKEALKLAGLSQTVVWTT